MCLVKVEKMPKLQTACTPVVQVLQVLIQAGKKVRQARKSMVEMLLGNHPLDCPVCDAGGDYGMEGLGFFYDAAESKYMETKSHKEEQQWSAPVDRARPFLFLCYRCVRVCDEAMDVAA